MISYADYRICEISVRTNKYFRETCSKMVRESFEPIWKRQLREQVDVSPNVIGHVVAPAVVRNKLVDSG